jgi:hypothetical protein
MVTWCTHRRPSPTTLHLHCPANLLTGMNHDVSVLSLLSEWCDVATDKVTLAVNPQGCRGLLATQAIEPTDTILFLPWKHVLGLRAASQIIDDETAKGRGMDDDNIMLQLILVCQGHEQRLWSCVMACALLSGLRYPLSSWSPYLACLPHDDCCDNNNHRTEPALRRTHALTARQSVKLRAKRDNPNRNKLSQETLQEMRRVREQIMAVPRTRDMALHHVLFWNEDELREIMHMPLLQEVTRDQTWLASVWEQLFNKPQRSNVDEADNLVTQSPIISLQSWMWAHAIVRSRAIGLDQSPKQIMEITYGGYTFRSKGVLLPIVDLINHDSTNSNAALQIRSEGIAVVATRKIRTHDEILFDYHPGATLSSLLQNYGFVDSSSIHQRQILKSWNGLIQVDIAKTSLHGMLKLASTEYDQSTGRLKVVIRDHDKLLQPSTLGSWYGLHRLAASACFLLMDQLEDHVGGNAVAASYRQSTYQLLQRTWLDLTAVIETLGWSDKT